MNNKRRCDYFFKPNYSSKCFVCGSMFNLMLSGSHELKIFQVVKAARNIAEIHKK